MNAFPASATYLIQTLDIALFASMEKKWREILDLWRKEKRYTFQKNSLHSCLPDYIQFRVLLIYNVTVINDPS